MNTGYGMQSRSSSGPNNVHLNPAFIQGQNPAPNDYGRSSSSAVYGDYRSSGGDMGSHLSEAEAEEILSKNRTVCSGAISRAVGDAASGELVSLFILLLT